MTRQEEILLARMIAMRRKLDSFEEAELKQLRSIYSSLKDELLNKVKTYRKQFRRFDAEDPKLLSLIDEVGVVHKAIEAKLTNELATATATAGAFSYKTMNEITSWDGKVKDFNNASLTLAQMKALVTDQKLRGKNLSEWIGDALAPDIDSIKSEIAAGYVQGAPYDEVVRRLQLALDVPNGSRKAKDLESVAKTYIQAMNVKAQQDVYEANKDIVAEVEWTAVMENGNVKTGRGTCPRCMALDGQRWATDDYARPPCPLHVRCRCMFYPITKTWRDLGFDIDEMEQEYKGWTIRDESNRELLDYGRTDQNYSGWWATQDKEFQDNAIGPRRADLVRSGKVKFEDLVDGDGNLINLADLRTVSFDRMEPTLYGHSYRTLSGKNAFGEGKEGIIGRILTISNDCDE